jgi:hypothetical protein
VLSTDIPPCSRTRGTNREGGDYGASNKCVIYEWRFRPPVITSPSRGRARPACIPSSELRARVLCISVKGRASPSAEIIAYGLDDRRSIPSRNRDFCQTWNGLDPMDTLGKVGRGVNMISQPYADVRNKWSLLSGPWLGD